jgi:O-antigen/teichoic acid export membrane protein
VTPTTPPTNAPSGATPVPTKTHSLTLSSGAVFAVSLATQIIGFGGNLALQREIGNASNAGLVLLSTAQLFLLIASSINGVGDLRLGTAYTYFLARGKPATDNTSTYLFLRMLMVAVAGVILFGIAPLSIGGKQIASGGTEMLSLGIFLVLPLLWSLSTVYNSLFIGVGNSVRAQYPILIESIARLPMLVFVAFYLPTLLGITVAYAVGAAVSAGFCLPAIVRVLGKFAWSEAARMFRFSWPLMGSLILSYLVTNMVPLLIAALLPGGQLAIFLAANGWRILVLSIPGAIATPLFPYLAGLHRNQDYEGIRRGTWQALRYSAMLLVPGVVGLVTYRSPIMNIQGGRFAGPGAIPLAILAVSALPLALSQIMQSSINAIGRQRLELYITSTQVAVLIALILALMPPFGILPSSDGLSAGAYAVLGSSVAALGLNTYFMESLIRVHIQPRSILGITLSAAGGFFAMSQFNRFLPDNRFFQLGAGLILGFAAYFAFLILVGELTREDVRLLSASIGLPRWLSSRIERLCWREKTPGLMPVDLSQARGLQPTELPATFVGETELPEIAPVSEDSSGPDSPK